MLNASSRNSIEAKLAANDYKTIELSASCVLYVFSLSRKAANKESGFQSNFKGLCLRDNAISELCWSSRSPFSLRSSETIRKMHFGNYVWWRRNYFLYLMNKKNKMRKEYLFIILSFSHTVNFKIQKWVIFH